MQTHPQSHLTILNQKPTSVSQIFPIKHILSILTIPYTHTSSVTYSQSHPLAWHKTIRIRLVPSSFWACICQIALLVFGWILKLKWMNISFYYNSTAWLDLFVLQLAGGYVHWWSRPYVCACFLLLYVWQMQKQGPGRFSPCNQGLAYATV